MIMKINDQRTKVIVGKDLLKLQKKYKIMGFTNNSKYYTVNLLSNKHDDIKIRGKSWSEYLQMIKYARILTKEVNK